VIGKARFEERRVKFFPIFMNIEKQPCLIVGGGQVAARKAFLLKRARAQITVVSPALCHELQELADSGEIEHIAGSFSEEQVTRQMVIIAATDNPAVNKKVSEVARSRGIPVNVVDAPELSSFITPSIVDRSPVQIAISTGGSSPVLSRLLRGKLETMIPSAYGRLASMVETFRDQVKAKFSTSDEIRKFWEGILEGPVSDTLLAGNEKKAYEQLQQAVETGQAPDERGEVFLVGAGPGDPDLLTFKALRLMQQADVVVYDRLVSDEILDLVRRDAEFIYAGKERNKHAIQQEDINALLANLAKQGKKVLRLKGGDPFIFGRGGEEIETLMEEGVRFQVVPGITAASGCASYAGIPLTHRDYVQSCTFVTGHLKDGSTDLNWKALAQPGQTVVFYMGLHGVSAICKGLIEHGLSAETPAALVEKGTRLDQKVHIGDLNSLPDMVKNNDIKPPTLIIVGEVVKLHDKLSWFEPAKVE
jgi:uroporphyrin-III C-methyltransferase/precorrin-2 dehydrogenase/sirohydrochlorin ferrochelatase